MVKRTFTIDVGSATSLALLVVGILIIGIVTLLAIRTQRGLLGLVLAGLAAALVVYWLREGRRTVMKELRAKGQAEPWTYDLIEEGEQGRLVAKVPGPESRVKVKVSGHALEIRGGDRFREVVSLARRVEVIATTYVNGVLQVRFKKLEAPPQTK